MVDAADPAGRPSGSAASTIWLTLGGGAVA